MDDYDDNPHVKYGTAVKIPEDKLDNLKYVPVHEQIVTDEEGRRRFHGAFTGGFSAGYYNTVGTKEGWTPSTFKSSRSKKSDRMTYAPQDFMDEEDRTNLGISEVNVSEEFMTNTMRSNLEEKQFKIQEDKMTLALGAELMETLVIPKRQNIGYKLLLKMGYKDDRGFSKKQKKKRGLGSKVYGCALPGEASESSSEEDSFGIGSVRFDDIEVIPEHLIQKGNYHGLGYQPLNPTEALHTKVKESKSVKATTKSGNRLSFMGQAFGVGAFEEEDEDIYTMDSMKNYDRIMGEEKNPDSTYGWTRPLAITGPQERQAIDYKTKALKGFVPAKEKVAYQNKKEYPLPVVPPDFDPHRRLKLRQQTERINMALSHGEHGSTGHSSSGYIPNKYSDMTYEERRQKLSDDAAPVTLPPSHPIKSVFDLISHEDRMKMEAAKKPKIPVELGFQEDVEKASKMEVQKPIDMNTPLCDPRALKPFSNNPEKQRRFEDYERAIRQRKKHPYSEIVSNLTEWERNHEREEFHRAYQVHNRLVAQTINSRFTKGESESTDEMLEQIKSGLTAPKLKPAFGTLTRENLEWHPDPLLCKRFNVPNPYPDSDFVGTPQDPYTTITPLALMHTVKAPEEPPITAEAKERAKRGTGIVSDTKNSLFKEVSSYKKGRWDEEPVMSGPSMRQETAQEEPEDSQEAEEKTEEATKEEGAGHVVYEEVEPPSMELFKSIFADDDDSDQESNQCSDEGETLRNEEKQEKPPERVAADEVFKRPIFQLPSKKRPPEKTENTALETDTATPPEVAMETEEGNSNAETSEDIFGPAPPPKRSGHFQDNGVDEEKASKKHKKSTKHKKHKKDHKHKKKKK